MRDRSGYEYQEDFGSVREETVKALGEEFDWIRGMYTSVVLGVGGKRYSVPVED